MKKFNVMKCVKDIMIPIAAMVLSIAVLSAGAAMAADNVVIGFEDPSQTNIDIQTYTENGFTLTNNNYAPGSYTALILTVNDYSIPGNSSSQSFGMCTADGTNAYGQPCSPTPITMTLTKTGGGAFSLTALDAANLLTENNNGQLTLIGHLQGGGTLTDTLSIGNTWTTFSLNGFSNVNSIDISASGGIYAALIDNMNVNPTPTPVPAAAWLLGSGMLGLFGMRRKSKNI
ncbi:MAG: VPLPA-CTERM sorting domain-containing protein [Geobacteraceae bacterium]|nr:VPLPA-CTERM sorting domain-containing protein [Geobacteraceae bacterium]